MTREEAIKILKFERGYFCDLKGCEELQAFTMAIKALEQVPCGKDINVPATDAISRQAVLDGLASIAKAKAKSDAQKSLMGRVMFFTEHLPPVTPQPKTVLYSGDGYADGYMVYDMAECPNCGYEYEDGDKDWGLSFCPNCGQALDWESEGEE